VHLDGGTDGKVNADNIIRFIHEQAGKKPLFLYMARREPHDPQFATEGFHQRYKAADIPLPVNFLPFHPFDNGDMTVRDEKTPAWPRTKENVSGKQNLYEFGGMHVPLIFAGPGIPKGETKSFAYLYDVYPTMCGLGGIPVLPELDAKSLVPVIAGKQAKVRDNLFTAYKNVQRSIRDERWKLIRYPQVNVTQLFDLQSDPHEMKNLAAEPESSAKVAELIALMQESQPQYGDNCALTVANPKPSEWTPPTGKEGTEPRKRKKKKSQ